MWRSTSGLLLEVTGRMPAGMDHSTVTSTAVSPRRRALLLTAAVALPPALVIGLLGLLGGLLVAVVLFLIVAAAVAVWVRFIAPQRLVAALPGAPASPSHHARLLNLVEGLCAGAGLRQPRVLVLEEPAFNALAAGLGPDQATLVFTTGLIDGLNRVELEAVVAELLVQIRRGEILPATVSAAIFGWGTRYSLATQRDADNDQAAVSLTRYPPGLIAAFARMDASGTAVQKVGRGQAHLWVTDPATKPSPSTVAASRHLPLSERIGALLEL